MAKKRARSLGEPLEHPLDLKQVMRHVVATAVEEDVRSRRLTSTTASLDAEDPLKSVLQELDRTYSLVVYFIPLGVLLNQCSIVPTINCPAIM